MTDGTKNPWLIVGLVGAGCGCIGVVIVAAVFLFGLGAARVAQRPIPLSAAPVATDEQTVRDELDIPASATLLYLNADPMTAGTFGREGLRIVAEFELTPAELTSYAASQRASARWRPLPAPAAPFEFDAPPNELPRGAERGLFFCRTGVYVTGTTFSPDTCSPPPPQFDQYRAAILDEDTRRLTVVFKNFY